MVNCFAYFAQMGIDIWLANSSATISTALPKTVTVSTTVIPTASQALALSYSHLALMGIQVWQYSEQGKQTDTFVSDNTSDRDDTDELEQQDKANKNNADIAQTKDWQQFQRKVRHCQQCQLAKTRTQVVFGVGHPQADCLLIGEAPGEQEDQQGLPFVGKSGQLLTLMIQSLGWQREQVYIANIVKCRPPNNRDPFIDEIEQCYHYLTQQIDWIQPKIIVAVGRVAARVLLQTKQSIGRLRGKVYQLPDKNIPVIVTYHPAYLLRQPLMKKEAWKDWQFVQRQLS